MTIILSIAIFQALFLVLLLFNKKKKRQSDFLLAVLILILAAQQTIFLINFKPVYGVADWLVLIGAGFPLLFGPSLYFYVLSLIRSRPVSWIEFAAHLSPYLFFEILVYIIHFSGEGATAGIIDGYIQFDVNLPDYIYYYGAVFALSGFLYPILCLWLLNRHSRSLKMQFSFVEDISLNWLKLLILGAFGSFLIGFTAFELIIGGRTADPKNAFYIVAVVNTIFIFVLGYFGLRQPNIFTDRTDFSQNQIKYQKSGLNDTESERIAKNLDVCMRENKLYLNSRLTLADLANELDTTANRLSQVMNGELGTNFYDYVNGFRIREVQSRIVDPEQSHLTFLGIALESGFNSKSSFNKLFKESTGLTPSEYKKLNKQ